MSRKRSSSRSSSGDSFLEASTISLAARALGAVTMPAPPRTTRPVHSGGHNREPGETTTFAPPEENSTGATANSVHNSRARPSSRSLVMAVWCRAPRPGTTGRGIVAGSPAAQPSASQLRKFESRSARFAVRGLSWSIEAGTTEPGAAGCADGRRWPSSRGIIGPPGRHCLCEGWWVDVVADWEWDDTLFLGTAAHYQRGRLPYAPGWRTCSPRFWGSTGEGVSSTWAVDRAPLP